ncbi:hypothetical protein L1280_001744 [Deinococcus sp. HSC-46F16]|nr:hypothetical protein [Deinococcus sp. HSC-46F16]MCP2014593.1 hypothetical protein [Deinococcus sp. HSC-46F16]
MAVLHLKMFTALRAVGLPINTTLRLNEAGQRRQAVRSPADRATGIG